MSKDLKIDQADSERVRILLTEAITVLCRNGLTYDLEFSVDGLLGITLDRERVLLVKIEQTVKTALAEAAEKKALEEAEAAEAAANSTDNAAENVNSSDESISNNMQPVEVATPHKDAFSPDTGQPDSPLSNSEPALGEVMSPVNSHISRSRSTDAESSHTEDENINAHKRKSSQSPECPPAQRRRHKDGERNSSVVLIKDEDNDSDDDLSITSAIIAPRPRPPPPQHYNQMRSPRAPNPRMSSPRMLNPGLSPRGGRPAMQYASAGALQNRNSQSDANLIKYAVSTFKEWLRIKKNSQTQFETIPAVQLSMLLREFYLNLRNKEGHPYTPSSLNAIRNGLNLYLRKPPIKKTFNIINDSDFKMANESFSKIMTLSINTHGNVPNMRAPGQLRGARQNLGKRLEPVVVRGANTRLRGRPGRPPTGGRIVMGRMPAGRPRLRTRGPSPSQVRYMGRPVGPPIPGNAAIASGVQMQQTAVQNVVRQQNQMMLASLSAEQAVSSQHQSPVMSPAHLSQGASCSPPPSSNQIVITPTQSNVENDTATGSDSDTTLPPSPNMPSILGQSDEIQLGQLANQAHGSNTENHPPHLESSTTNRVYPPPPAPHHSHEPRNLAPGEDSQQNDRESSFLVTDSISLEGVLVNSREESRGFVASPTTLPLDDLVDQDLVSMISDMQKDC